MLANHYHDTDYTYQVIIPEICQKYEMLETTTLKTTDINNYSSGIQMVSHCYCCYCYRCACTPNESND